MKKKKSIALWAVLFWLLVWQLGSMALHRDILLVSPVRVAQTLLELAGTRRFWASIGGSLVRIVGGFMLAAVCGTLAAALAARFRRIEELLAPLVLAMKTIPVASFIILALIWMGSKNLAVLIAFLMVFPILYTNVLSGIRATDDGLREMARVFRVTPVRRVRFIDLPQVMPYFRTGCTVGLGLCWKAGTAAEVIGIPEHSIGEQLYTAKIYLETDRLFAWTAVIIAMSWFLERGFLILLEKAGQRLHTSASVKTAVRKNAGVPSSIPSGRIKAMAGSLRPREVCARHLSKSYQGRPVLSDVSLTVQPRERCALMAPSGMGKTTLFRLLLGLETTDQGNIQTASAGAVFQENRLIESLSPIENVRLALPPLPKADTRAELFSILSSLLPAESLTRPVSTLSGGMKRRCALARALLSPSEILILDEPFTGLDEDTKKQAVQFIETWQKGRPLLFSTHDPKDVLLLQARLLPVDFKQS